MMEFLCYVLKVTVSLTFLYLFFRLLLKRETWHRINRITLLACLGLAFVLPYLNILEFPAIGNRHYIKILGTISVDKSEKFWNLEIAGLSIWAWLFIIGSAIYVVYYAVNLIKLVLLIRKSQQMETLGHAKLLVCDENISPFSWMDWIVLSKMDYEDDYSFILEHEKAHLALYHSYDLMLVDLLLMMQWFNPALWMLRRDLKELHEYEADHWVLSHGADMKAYQYSLVRKSAEINGFILANNYSYKSLKGRMNMMLKAPSSHLSCMKLVLLLPLLFFCQFINARYLSIEKEPYILLDGNPITIEELQQVDPHRIESMEVMKVMEVKSSTTHKDYEGMIVITTKDRNK